MPYGLLADLVVALHLLYVLFVVGGAACILVGAARGWRWIRHPGFRLAHLLAILVVAVLAVLGADCPLTEWEWALRRHAGQAVEQDISFVGRVLRTVIFFELPERVFTVVYVAFAGLVIVTVAIVPPRWRRSSTP